LTSVPAGSASLIVTSPPYPGVYDYASQHAARLQFLGLSTGDFERGEIGSRRKLDALPHAAAVSFWETDLGKCVAAMRRVLDVRGVAVLILADSVVASRPVFADRVIANVSAKTGMKVVASAAQVRPHFHAESRRAFVAKPRREHVIVLARDGR
jgi:DNA modification methylase